MERRAGARTGPGRGARAPQAGRHKKKTAAGRGAAGAHKATSVSSSASAESGWFASALSPSASSSDRNADPAIPAKHPTLTPPARTRIKNLNITTERRAECFKLCSRSICHLSARRGVASVAPRARALVPPVGFTVKGASFPYSLRSALLRWRARGSSGRSTGPGQRDRRSGCTSLTERQSRGGVRLLDGFGRNAAHRRRLIRKPKTGLGRKAWAVKRDGRIGTPGRLAVPGDLARHPGPPIVRCVVTQGRRASIMRSGNSPFEISIFPQGGSGRWDARPS